MSFSQKPRIAVRKDFTDSKSLTEQSHKQSVDIHYIMRKAEKTGIIEHVNKHAGTYGEMPSGDEFHRHMNIIAQAETMFESVPSSIRKEFENSPAKFLDFIQNDANYDKAKEMGFDVSHLTAPEPPIKAPVADPKPKEGETPASE
jgi:phage internal scaffolding protein